MLTKNFYKIFAEMFRRRKGTAQTVTVTDCTGESISMEMFSDLSVDRCAPYTLLGSVCSLFSTYHGIWYGSFLGTGKTPATVDDYVMEAPISGDGRVTIATPLDNGLVIAYNPTYMSMSATHAVTNNTSQPIEVTEIGLYGKMIDQTEYPPVLLEHTVLETPIVLPPGETVPITYEIKFPYGV